MRYYGCINHHFYKTEGQDLMFCGNCKDILVRIPWPFFIFHSLIGASIISFFLILFWTGFVGLVGDLYIWVMPTEDAQVAAALVFTNRWIVFFLLLPSIIILTLKKNLKKETKEYVLV